MGKQQRYDEDMQGDESVINPDSLKNCETPAAICK